MSDEAKPSRYEWPWGELVETVEYPGLRPAEGFAWVQWPKERWPTNRELSPANETWPTVIAVPVDFLLPVGDGPAANSLGFVTSPGDKVWAPVPGRPRWYSHDGWQLSYGQLLREFPDAHPLARK